MDFDAFGKAAGYGKGMVSNAAMAIQKLAEERAQRTGETVAKATDEILKTDEGKRLYEETIR